MKLSEEALLDFWGFVEGVASSGCACGGATGPERCFYCDAKALLKKHNLQQKESIPPSGAPGFRPGGLIAVKTPDGWEKVTYRGIDPDKKKTKALVPGDIVRLRDVDARKNQYGLGVVKKVVKLGRKRAHYYEVRWTRQDSPSQTRRDCAADFLDQHRRRELERVDEKHEESGPPRLESKVTVKSVSHGDSLQWLCNMLGDAIRTGEVEAQRVVGEAPSNLDELADILEHFGNPEAALMTREIAKNERDLAEMCDVIGCKIDEKHTHCPECGSTDHDAASCDNGG